MNNAEVSTPNPAEEMAGGLKQNGSGKVGRGDLSVILAGLQTMRDGDFSVRLPSHWTGLAGKVADTFNEIVAANQQMAQELKRVGQAVGKEGRTREHAKFYESRGAPGAKWRFRLTRWLRTYCGRPRK